MGNARTMGINEVLTADSTIRIGKAFRVYLDGVEQTHVISATAGMIRVFKRKDGEFVFAGNELATECRYGEVRVEEIA
jgi:hypothetical protein